MMTQEFEPQQRTIESLIEERVLGLTDRDGGLKSGHVPLDLIDAKDVPVNKENLDLIGVQLKDESEHKGTDGQIQPIMLGQVHGDTHLHIIDGFHRFTKFTQDERVTIFATIIEVSREELLDKRIQNTRNHAGLQFARATQWVHEAWALNPYADRVGVLQAFPLGRTKASNGKRLGLNPEEVEEIMSWIEGKSALWGVEPMTIYSYLKTDANVAEDLVRNSRPDANQASSGSSLPQSTLSSIGKQIPGREELQRAVATIITQNKLSGTGISGILADIKFKSDEDALAYLQEVDIAAYKERIANKQKYQYTEDDVLRLGRIRESSPIKPLGEAAALTCIHIDEALEEGEYDPTRMQNVASELGKIITLLSAKQTAIETALAGIDNTRNFVAYENTRSIEDFTGDLQMFLLEPSESIQIMTGREARTAERALSRGRGTKVALARLEAIIEAYYSQHGV